MKKSVLIITFLLFTFGIFYFFKSEPKTASKTPLIEQNTTLSTDYTKPFRLNLTDKNFIKMQKTKNGFSIKNNATMTIFAFFASWCEACRVQNEILNSIAVKYASNVQVIGVLINDDIDKNATYAFADNLKFPVAFGESNDYFAGALGGVAGIPFMVMFDNKGKIIENFSGLVPEEILSTEIERNF